MTLHPIPPYFLIYEENFFLKMEMKENEGNQEKQGKGGKAI
jgi:hypothetical protein